MRDADSTRTRLSLAQTLLTEMYRNTTANWSVCEASVIKHLGQISKVNIIAFESLNKYAALPPPPTDVSRSAKNKRLKLADPDDSLANLPIEILIGTDFYWNDGNSEPPVKLSDSLTLVPSIFGCILSGLRSHVTVFFIPTVHNINVNTSTQALDDADFPPEIEAEKYDNPNLNYQEISNEQYLINARSRSTKIPFLENINLLNVKKISEKNSKRITDNTDALQRLRLLRQENIESFQSPKFAFTENINELSEKQSNKKEISKISGKINSLDKSYFLKHKNIQPFRLTSVIFTEDTNQLKTYESSEETKRIAHNTNSLKNHNFFGYKNTRPFRRQSFYPEGNSSYQFYPKKNPVNIQSDENELQNNVIKPEGIGHNAFSNRKEIYVKPAVHDIYHSFNKPVLGNIRQRHTDNNYTHLSNDGKRNSVNQFLNSQPKEKELKRMVIDKINYFEIDDTEKGIKSKDTVAEDAQKIPLDGTAKTGSKHSYLLKRNYEGNVYSTSIVNNMINEYYSATTESIEALSKGNKNIHARVVEVYQEPVIPNDNTTRQDNDTNDIINNSDKKRKDLERLLRVLTDDLGEEEGIKIPADEETEIRILVRKVIRQHDSESEKNRSAYFGSVSRWKEDPGQQEQPQSDDGIQESTTNSFFDLKKYLTLDVATTTTNVIQSKDFLKKKRSRQPSSWFLSPPGNAFLRNKISKRSHADNLDELKLGHAYKTADNYSSFEEDIKEKIRDFILGHSQNISNNQSFDVDANKSNIDINEEPLPESNVTDINKAEQVNLKEKKRSHLINKPGLYNSLVGDILEVKTEQPPTSILPTQPPHRHYFGISDHLLMFPNDSLPTDITYELNTNTGIYALPKVLGSQNVTSANFSENFVTWNSFSTEKNVLLLSERSSGASVPEFPQIQNTSNFSKQAPIYPKNNVEWMLRNILQNRLSDQRTPTPNIEEKEPEISRSINAMFTSNTVDENPQSKYLKSLISNTESSTSSKLISFKRRNESPSIAGSAKFSHTSKTKDFSNKGNELLNFTKEPFGISDIIRSTEKAKVSITAPQLQELLRFVNNSNTERNVPSIKEICNLCKKENKTVESTLETCQKTKCRDVSDKVILQKYLGLVTPTTKIVPLHEDDTKMKINVVDILKNLDASKNRPESKLLSKNNTKIKNGVFNTGNSKAKAITNASKIFRPNSANGTEIDDIVFTEADLEYDLSTFEYALFRNDNSINKNKKDTDDEPNFYLWKFLDNEHSDSPTGYSDENLFTVQSLTVQPDIIHDENKKSKFIPNDAQLQKLKVLSLINKANTASIESNLKNKKLLQNIPQHFSIPLNLKNKGPKTAGKTHKLSQLKTLTLPNKTGNSSKNHLKSKVTTVSILSIEDLLPLRGKKKTVESSSELNKRDLITPESQSDVSLLENFQLPNHASENGKYKELINRNMFLTNLLSLLSKKAILKKDLDNQISNLSDDAKLMETPGKHPYIAGFVLGVGIVAVFLIFSVALYWIGFKKGKFQAKDGETENDECMEKRNGKVIRDRRSEAVDSSDVRYLKHLVAKASTLQDSDPITKENPKRLQERVFCKNHKDSIMDKIRKQADGSKFFDVYSSQNDESQFECNMHYSEEEGSDQDSLSAFFNPKRKSSLEMLSDDFIESSHKKSIGNKRLPR
ncbi:uncharacterized protein NPIL_61311 [Nephila pilipes]|uniref:Uncharacterized protein n=1 Tax=Nephila pilipes TaxID=299642 RepID=A0A8X6NMC6_NEPPI|nr:uncharacterized protein NPIL_61311 [Nephila pilipes]